ncbi:MAG: Trm112 family protein [Acidobacteriaceae bacterium]
MHAAPSIARMLDTIVCPACRGRLAIGPEQTSIICIACARRYTLHDGIPVLIAERASS